MSISTPKRLDQTSLLKQTRQRLDKCWQEDINWNLYPDKLKNGCMQIGKALSIPPTAVLSSLLGICGFVIAPSIVEVDGTDWKEPVIIWECVCMPTGAGKSPLWSYIDSLLSSIKEKSGSSPCWQVGDATFEKMGELMHCNSGRILGMYDELTTFLTQLNVYQGRGLSNSHELALFLQLYNGHAWTRNTVAGDANFQMSSTSLTLVGFTQPNVSRSLIENTSNIEKGLSQRFIWIFPKPTYAEFESLQPVDSTFTQALVSHLSKYYKKRGEKTVYHISKECKQFQSVYNSTQHQLKALGGTDELLCGMLSKSKGQILRTAAVLHVLFKLQKEEDDDIKEISSDAMAAAIDFIQTSIQHTAYIAGKDTIVNEVEKAETDDIAQPDLDKADIRGYTILQPGKRLDLSALLKAKVFKNKGHKSGAVEAMKKLQEAGFGELKELGSARGTSMKYLFEKSPIPERPEEKVNFVKKLSQIGVTLRSYSTAYEKDEITSSISHVPMNNMDMADSPSMSGKRKFARLYIQEGPVSIIQGLHQQDRYMFLFDDLLLIAKSSGKPSSKHKQHKTFRLKHRVRVSEMWISECVDKVTDASISLENAFVFGWPTCNLVAAFSTTGERELWKGLFTKHIDTQQQLIESKTMYIHIFNEVDLSTSMGPPETLEVDYNETVRDVLAKALEIFRISDSAYSFQLWVKLSRTDDGYPLIGHEFPYAIHLSSARNDQAMDSNTHVQFVIRRRQRLVEPSSTENTPSHQAHTKRPYNIRRTIKNLPWTKWKKQREIVKPKVKFFGTPLQQVMPEGRMSGMLQAILTRMYVDGPLTHGILRKSANAQKVKELKAAIDNGQQVDLESVATHVVAALFKEFLRNIPGGLLPSSRYTVLVASNDCKDIDDRAIRISREVDKFAVENRELVKHVIPLLHHISRFNATNAMSTTNIAICLAPSLLWPDTGLDVIMNEVPPLVQFLIEHSPKIFGPDLPELFENLPPPASDFDPSTTDNTPPVTLVPTKKEDGSNKKITTRIPISISSEESFHSQGDTSLSDDSLGETQVHSDSMLYEDNVSVNKKGSKHIAQGGRGSVILSGQSIASLHQDTDEDEDDVLPLPKVLPDDAQSDEDMRPTGVRTFSNHWRRAPPRNRHRSNKGSEESRRRSHIGLQHEPLSITTSVSPSGSQSSSSPNLSPKDTLREKRVQSDTVLDDDVPVRRRNKRGGNTANGGRPVGIIEVQQHSPYSSGAFITTTGTVTERFRNVPQYPSTYSFDSRKSSNSEERARNTYNSSVTEKDKYTTGGSPKTNFRKRLEVNDRSIAFDFPKRRSLRGGNKEKRSRKAGRSQSMKETLRPESLIVNVHYHTTSSSYDDLTKFKRGQIGDYAAQIGDYAPPVQAGEGPVDDFPESEQNLRNLHNGINKPATYQSKEVNRPFPLKIQNSQQNTSPRASRLLPDNEETKLKMVSTLKQKAIAKLARTGSTQQSPTDTNNTNIFSGLQRKSTSSISPIERKSPPTHRHSSNFTTFLSAGGASNDRIEPCRITRRYAGQPRGEPKRKSLVDGIAEEKRETNRDWKSQAPTMAEKKKVWQEFISKPSAERRSRIESESGGTVKAELDAAHQKLQTSKQETAQEEVKPKPTMHQVSKFVTTAMPRVAIRQFVVKSHVLTKSKPRKIIFYPPRRIVEVYK